jgi:hypothetical protein
LCGHSLSQKAEESHRLANFLQTTPLKAQDEHFGIFKREGEGVDQTRFRLVVNMSEDEAREALLVLLKKR